MLLLNLIQFSGPSLNAVRSCADSPHPHKNAVLVGELQDHSHVFSSPVCTCTDIRNICSDGFLRSFCQFCFASPPHHILDISPPCYTYLFPLPLIFCHKVGRRRYKFAQNQVYSGPKNIYAPKPGRDAQPFTPDCLSFM